MGVFDDKDIIQKIDTSLLNEVYKLASQMFIGVLKEPDTLADINGLEYKFEDTVYEGDKLKHIYYTRHFSKLKIIYENSKIYISRVSPDLPILIKKNYWTYHELADKLFKIAEFKDSDNLMICDIAEFFESFQLTPVKQTKDKYQINNEFKPSIRTYPITMNMKIIYKWYD